MPTNEQRKTVVCSERQRQRQRQHDAADVPGVPTGQRGLGVVGDEGVFLGNAWGQMGREIVRYWRQKMMEEKRQTQDRHRHADAAQARQPQSKPATRRLLPGPAKRSEEAPEIKQFVPGRLPIHQ
jgi:hypothetical protein